LLAAAILFGSFNTVDFYPQAFRTFLRLHSVKALPCAIIWLVVIYQMTRSDFKQFQVGKSSSLPLT
jgi:hypothetical protein